MAVFTLLKHFFLVQRKADRLWQSCSCSPELSFSVRKYWAFLQAFLTYNSGLCNSRWNFYRVSEMSNCMLCTVLHCLPLPRPRRIHSLWLLFHQSTPLPPAQQLTRWRGHLQQLVVAPTQDLLSNLWPTHLSLTLHAHRAAPACSSHRMGRWINKHHYVWKHNVTNVVLVVILSSYYSQFWVFRLFCVFTRVYFSIKPK